MTFDTPDNWRGSILKGVGRLGLTLAVLGVLMALSIFPFRIGHFDEIRPAYLLMAVYYWAVMRPAALPPLPTFLVGLLQDLVSGYPLGLNAFTLVAAQWLMKTQRKFLLGQSFLVVWAGLALVAFLALAAQWAFFSLFYFSIMSIQSAAVSLLLTAAFYPLVVLPLAALDRALSSDPSSMA